MYDTKFSLPLQKKEQLNEDTWSFYFQRKSGDHEFKPGQYFEIKLDIKNPDERGDTRVFSISSSPTEKEYFTITTRIIESSFKKSLLALHEGTSIQFEGPWDDLDINLNDTKPKVFLAGGIGITPFHSIVKYCLDSNLNASISLFVSWSGQRQAIFHEFFRSAEKKIMNFKYIPTITQDGKLEDWNGERGRIDQSAIERHVDNPGEHSYYIVGAGGFVKGIEKTLLGMNISQENIISEHFSGY